MKHSTTPGCKYNPEGIQCDPNGRHCEKCGHNPAVASDRLQKFQKQLLSYPTELQHLPPVETERILGGKWNIPAVEQ